MVYTVTRTFFQKCLSGLLSMALIAFAHGDVARGSAPAELRMTPSPVQSSGDWTYTVRPGDNLSSISTRLLRSQKSAGDLVSYNDIGADRSLTPGETLKVPLRWLEQRPRPATATSVHGQVFAHLHLERGRQPLETGQKLNVGDEIRTARGRAIITLADDSMIRMDPRTRLKFDRLRQYGRTGMADTRMNLERGRIDTRVQTFEENGSRFEIETPSAVAAVRGTAFSLESREDGTLLEVREGKVLFGDRRDQELVQAGQSAFQPAAGDRVIQPLEPAPQVSDAIAEVDELPVELGWKSQGGESSYRVNLFERANGDWLLRREMTSSRIKLRDLDNGDYRLRVASIDRNGRHSRVGSLDFEVGLQPLPAELDSPAREEVIQSPRPEFTWERHNEDAQARIEVSHSRDFEDRVATSGWGTTQKARLESPLEPGRYFWRVTTRRGGTSTATSEIRTFTMKPVLDKARIISTNTIDNRINLYWSSVEHAQSYRLQIARDKAFNHIVSDLEVDRPQTRVQLEAGGNYHIRVKGEASGSATSDWGSAHEITLE